MLIFDPPLSRVMDPAECRGVLAPWVDRLNAFEYQINLRGLPYRKDHQWKVWEGANILRQLDLLQIPPGSQILDTGSGASYIPLYLATQGWGVVVEDGMYYGDITPWLIEQCQALNVQLPIVRDPMEAMVSLPDAHFAVTLAISTIEHVGREVYSAALHELARVTQPGGYVFLTSDFFASEADADRSPYKQCQQTQYREESIRAIPEIEPRLSFVGGVDLRYRGHFICDCYSFVNCCFRVDAPVGV